MDYQDAFSNNLVPAAGLGYVSVVLTASQATNWPYNYVGDGLVTATIMDVACEVGNVLSLPPVDQVSVGEAVIVRNVGANALRVHDSNAVTLAVIAAGVAQLFWVKDNVYPGAWGQVTYGAGAAAATAGALAGFGTKATGATLSVAAPVLTIASSLSLTVGHRGQAIEFTGGAVSLSLDSASTYGSDFFCYIKNSGSGLVTITPSAGGAIDGQSALSLQPSESLILLCTGSTDWFSVGYGRSILYQFSQLVLDVSAGGTFTLSSAQASNKILVFTGNPATEVSIIVPSVISVYYVANKLSTAQNIQVRTSGSPGAIVGQSQRIILVCDSVIVTATQASIVNGPLSLLDGSEEAPSLNFASQTNTGLFKYSSGGFGISSQGVTQLYSDGGGVEFPLGLSQGGVIFKTSNTGSMVLPVGDSLQRDAYPQFGMLRGNQDTGSLEYFTGTEWGAINGSSVMNEDYKQGSTGSVVRNLGEKLREFVSVKDFGAVGDGVTDDATAIQAAIEAVNAAGGGVLLFPPGHYISNSLLNIGDGVYIEGYGAEVTNLDFSQKGFFANTGYNGLLTAAGAGPSNTVSVTSTVLAGSVAIPVSSIIGFGPGDFVQILSTEVVFSEATIGEMAQVQWADSGFVYLKSPLEFNYNTSLGTVTLNKVDFITGGIKGLKITGSGVNPAGLPVPTYTGTPSEVLAGTDRSDCGISIIYGKDWHVENVVFDGVENRCVQLFSCVGSRMIGCTVMFDTINILSQYGISIWGTSINTTVENNTFYNGRHHVTTLSASSIATHFLRGMPVGILVNGNKCKGSWVYALDTHQAGSRITFSNNIIDSLCGGIEVRTPKTTVIGNIISLPTADGLTPGVALRHGVAIYYNNSDIVVSGNNIVGGQIGIYVSFPITVGSNVSITNNRLSGFTGSGINVNDTDGLSVTGNLIVRQSGATSYGIAIYDVKYGNVSSNTIVMSASTSSYGIYISGTAVGDTARLSINGNSVSKISGTIYGIGFNNNVENCSIGHNELSSCNSTYITGTSTTNVYSDRRYTGTVTIASDAITCPLNASGLALDTEASAATDNLTTINGGTDGQVIVIRSATGSRVPTLVDGGNLLLAGNFALTTSSHTITLIKIRANWYEVSRSIN